MFLVFSAWNYFLKRIRDISNDCFHYSPMFTYVLFINTKNQLRFCVLIIFHWPQPTIYSQNDWLQVCVQRSNFPCEPHLLRTLNNIKSFERNDTCFLLSNFIRILKRYTIYLWLSLIIFCFMFWKLRDFIYMKLSKHLQNTQTDFILSNYFSQ